MEVQGIVFLIGHATGDHVGHLLVYRRPTFPEFEIYCVDCGASLYRKVVM